MSVLEFKMFNFFKLIPLDKNVKYENIKENITTHCSNAAYKIFCTANGAFHVFFKDWECLSFQITDNPINFCSVTDESDILVVLEQHRLSNEIELKIYNISKLTKRKPATPAGTATVECNSKVKSLKVFFNLESQVCVAIGLEKGNILFYKATLTRDISAGFKSINVCPKAIKGIEFLRTDMGDVKMFACSDVGVFCYTVSSSGSIAETKVILDDKVEPIHCWTLMRTYQNQFANNQYFVVGRSDALYCYTFEGRGPCYAIDGAKQMVKWFGSLLIVVLRSTKPWHLQEGLKTSQLVIINIDNKMIVLNQELNAEVSCILPTADFSNCFIFLADGHIFTLQERELQYKIKLLFSKNLYDIAIKLLEDSNAGPDILANALVRYGDHLFQRGDILAGVRMYIKTIGLVSPYCIINKLMNSRHNQYLILYLRSLVESDANKGNSEYVDLLRNCCHRVELPGKVSKNFQEEESKHTQQMDGCILIESHSKISTLLNVIHDSQQVQHYFSSMTDKEIIDFFEEFGHWLMTNYPAETTDIIKYLTSENSGRSHQAMDKLIRYFVPLLLMNKQCAFDVIQSLDTKDGMSNKSNINTIWVDLILRMWKLGHVDINYCMDFLRSHSSELNADDVFIICRSHEFWPGIIMMYEKCNREILSMRCLVNCFEMSPANMIDFVQNVNNGPSHQMWIQSLSKKNLYSNNSQKFVNALLGRMINTNPNYILNVLQNIVSNNSLQLAHLNELFSQDNFLTMFKSDDLETEVALLEKRVSKITQMLQNYKKCPIEFRSRSCDVCKQPINQPSVYFLCQHSYHRECIHLNSEGLLGCVVCEQLQKTHEQRRQQNQKQMMLDKMTSSQNCSMQAVSNKLGSGFYSKANDSKVYAKQTEHFTQKQIPITENFTQKQTPIKSIKNEIPITTNPFENVDEAEASDPKNPFDEYDANLNPFEQDS